MNVISNNLVKLSNISKNIKSMLDNFNNKQITIVQNIINEVYSHAIQNGVVKNSKLLQLFNKLNSKHYLNVVNGKITFPAINPIANTDNFAKIYSSYLDKIVSYLQKNIRNANQWNNLFVLINSQQLDNLTSTASVFVQQNDLNIAQETQVLIKRSALQNIILADINRIDFAENEEKTVDIMRIKLSVGNKHQQIQNSDVKVLVDVEDVKNILFNNEKDNLDNNNQSSALN